MDEWNYCRGCGAERPADAPSGLCPACLLKGGLLGEGSELHEMTITFANAIPAETFKTLDGVIEVNALNEGHGLHLAMQGPADAVIKAAARYPVVSLTTYEPSLEDIFLRYYEADGPRATEADHVA